MSKTHYAESIALTTLVLTGSVYLAFYTTAPTDETAGVEVSGGSYARQLVSFGAVATVVGVPGSTVASTNVATFPLATASWGTIVGAALCDASSGGNEIYWASLSPTLIDTTTSAPTFAIGSIIVMED